MALHSEFAQFEVLIVVVDWKDGIIGRTRARNKNVYFITFKLWLLLLTNI
jgi:hypothetical protein